jgi:hypothetical protein
MHFDDGNKRSQEDYAACNTLRRLGFEFKGGTEWEAPQWYKAVVKIAHGLEMFADVLKDEEAKDRLRYL